MGVWDDFVKKVETVKDDAVEWWEETEDDENPPKTYSEQAASEVSSDGSTQPKVNTAQTNTGETIVYASSGMPNTTYLIGGAVLVVVVLGFALMMGRK